MNKKIEDAILVLENSDCPEELVKQLWDWAETPIADQDKLEKWLIYAEARP